jgi:hypothetical protein
MKGLTVVLLSILPFYNNYAQDVFTNKTHATLQQVISDYPNHFKHIRGELLNTDPQTSDYASSVVIPGSLNTVITKYSSSDEKEVVSWRCLMAESDDFEVIAKRYKELYNQIKNSIIKVDGEKPFILNGSYETPLEEKQFTTSSLQLLPAVGDLSKVKVEITLEFLVTEWKLSLLVYDQEEEKVVME